MSNEFAACVRIDMRFLSECPRQRRRSINFVKIVLQSSGLFCSQYLCISPAIRPFRQLGGCADNGGMYK